MGAIIKHTKEDVKRFRAEKCESCHCLRSCLSFFNDMDKHIPSCPKFFNFMIGYKSFVEEQIEYDRLHPEEVEVRRQKNLEVSKMIKNARKSIKKS